MVDHLGLSKDILHIWLGILFYLCFTIIFRRNFRDKLPLILLLLLTLLGEFLDMGERLITNPQLHLVIMQDHYHDLFYTCIAPFAIFVASWIIYWRDRRRDKKLLDKKLLDKKLPDKNNRQNEQS